MSYDAKSLREEIAILRASARVVDAPIPKEKDVEKIINEVKGQLSDHDAKDIAKRIYNDFEFFASQIDILYRPGMNPEHPHGGSGPMKLNDAQRKLIGVFIEYFVYRNIPLRAVVLKARQLGCTTLLLVFELWLAMKIEHLHIMFIIDKDDHFAAKRIALIDWITRLNQKYPFLPKIAAKSGSLIVLSNKSKFFLESAQSPNPGTSEMIHILHESEKPKWPRNRAKQVKESIHPSIPHSPGTMHISESTAKGAETFYQEFRDAKDGKSSYLALFVPWYLSKEYSEKSNESFSWSTSDEHGDVEFDSEGNKSIISEMEYAARYSLSISQILWRRRKINDMGGLAAFDQEYPTSPSHAFRNSHGNNFFQARVIDAQGEAPQVCGDIIDKNGSAGVLPTVYTSYSPAIVYKDNAPLRIYEPPKEEQQYYIGIDFAEGKTIQSEEGESDPDFTVITVKNKMGKTVAVWKDRIKPELVWFQIVLIGILYNLAYLNGERNGPGNTARALLIMTGYPHNFVNPQPASRPIEERMWTVTDRATRPVMLNALRYWCGRNAGMITSKSFIEQCGTFVHNPKSGKPEASPGCHDDDIMSEALSEHCRLAYEGVEFIEPTPEVKQARPIPADFSSYTIEDCLNGEEIRELFD